MTRCDSACLRVRGDECVSERSVFSSWIVPTYEID